MLSFKKHPYIGLSVVISDITAILTSFFLAYQLRFFGQLVPHKGIPAIESYFRAMVIVIPVYLLMFRAYQLYRPERHVRRIYEMLNMIKAITMATIFLMAVTFFYREFSYSRVVLLFAWFLSIFFCGLARYFLIQFEYFVRQRKDRQRILLVGVNKHSRNLIRWTKENPHYGQDIVAILSSENSNEGKHLDGIPIIGRLQDLDKSIDELQIDGVILTDSDIPREVVADITLKCENKMIGFKVVADFYGLISHHVEVEYISNVPLLGLKALPLDDAWNRVVKRMFDLVGALFFLVILFPFLLLISIAIKLQDGGPIFYKQERVGQDEECFMLYKFRTMCIDAEGKTGPVWTSQNDHRVTRLGKILRRTNLDELPQLWNVLVGNMSLVGPRPERPHFVKQFRDQIPRYMSRHKIKAGLTGWAQIHGLRGNTSLEERIKYDLFYMENWSPMMDLEILFATLFTYKNAY